MQGQLAAAGEREHSIQRQLTLAEMRLEEAAESAGASAAAEQEQLVQRLMEQRDAAHAALQVGRAAQHSRHCRCLPLLCSLEPTLSGGILIGRSCSTLRAFTFNLLSAHTIANS